MNTHKDILILYTGGTIGMVPSDKGHIPSVDFCDDLLHRLSPYKHELSAINVHVMATNGLIDSANTTPNDWLDMAVLLVTHWQDYDGFVILHGTDTMAYSASALSFMLGNIDKPVIFTGAQIPMISPNSDALDNVLGSLAMASQHQWMGGSGTQRPWAEVGLFFAHTLWRGNRSSKIKRQALDAFYSPNFPALAHYLADGTIQHASPCALSQAEQPVFIKPQDNFAAAFAFKSDQVVVFTCYPGMDHRLIEAYLAVANPHAMILQTFGVGNPPDANQALMKTLATASQNGVLIVNVSQCPVGCVQQSTYASGSALHAVGAIGSGDLTLEATFTKVHVLLAQGHDTQAIRGLLTQPLYGECSP